MYQTELIDTTKLKPFPIREMRPAIIERIKARIESAGYNPSRPLSVVKQNGYYLVADGNHRLEVIRQMNIESVPCVVYEEGHDPYSIAVNGNQDEDTYAPMDLFDWLDVIGRLQDEGLTQEKIGEVVGWSRDKIQKYIILRSQIVTEVLAFAKANQKGRVTINVTTGTTNERDVNTFDFTEGWFRNSGLYELRDDFGNPLEEYQMRIMKAFAGDKFNWNNAKIRKETQKFLMWHKMRVYAENALVDKSTNEGGETNLDIITAMIENGTFTDMEQLKTKIEDLNRAAKNKLIHGDALEELKKLEDATIDVVITDPPYGINYTSNRSRYTEHVTREEIHNDGQAEALTLLDSTCEILNRKTKPDAHLYFFTSWKTYPEFAHIISKHFEVKNCIIWDKGNAGTGDLENTWGNAYEMIVFASKGNKKLNVRKNDVINVARIPSVRAIHPTQKPEGLIRVLLEVSAQKADTICDPFMGSGSTIKAIKETGGMNYIGIEIDKERFDKAEAYVGGEQ